MILIIYKERGEDDAKKIFNDVVRVDAFINNYL